VNTVNQVITEYREGGRLPTAGAVSDQAETPSITPAIQIAKPLEGIACIESPSTLSLGDSVNHVESISYRTSSVKRLQ